MNDLFERQVAIDGRRSRFLHVANGTCTTQVIQAAETHLRLLGPSTS